MTAVVVDIGNTRIKWGLCRDGRVTAVAALLEDEAAWQQQLTAWQLAPTCRWTLSGVHPQRGERLQRWLERQGAMVQTLSSCQQLPLTVAVEQPEKVGLDRLLNAVAANTRRPAEHAALIVDAGSAVTVDLVDSDGVFRGGAILPGLRLMAKALHDYTALLPCVEVREPSPALGTNTRAAIAAGVYWAVVGGVEEIIHRQAGAQPVAVFLTGGDAAVLTAGLTWQHQVWPEMTLEGVRLSARVVSD